MASVDRFAFSSAAAPRPLASGPSIGPVDRVPPDRVRDLTALALLAACVFLAVALATFHPADPPLPRTFPPHARATNACGLWGAVLATALHEWLGLAAWLALGCIAACDLALLARRALPDLPLRTAGALVAIAGSCTLLATFLPDWIPRPLWGPGGRVGAMGRLLAETYLARTGAAIVVTALVAGGLFVAFDAVILHAWRLALVTGGHLLGVGVRVGARFRSVWRRAPSAALPATSTTRPRSFPWSTGRSQKPDAEPDEESDEGSESGAPADDSTPGDEPQRGPKIRVRRRQPEPKPAPEPSPVEDEDDLTGEVDGEADAEVEESTAERAAETPAAVPIRSRASRRRSTPELELFPDPAAEYALPDIELLLPTELVALDEQEQEVRDRARVLEKTFGEFGFKVRVVEIETGPVISQYEIELEAGLRLAKITNLADDLAIALRVPSVRIVAPIPGKNSVGIEVPNTTRQMVRLREVIEETQAKSRSMKIPIYLGKDVAGNPMVVDMASLPHLLIAGRTGTGKSVCLNSIIVSMLMTRRPDEVRMLMIDPKMVELTPYKALPHLMHPVVTDMRKAEAILAWAVEKMEERYALLARAGVRHLTQYNALGRDTILERLQPETDDDAAAIPTTMPFIVIVADEIADMMMTAGKEIEAHIIRLAQKSRAVGIHLILATQKPTVDVITGLIKSNLPARIAFQVASRTDSRVVLDECGAERLLGNGDMLFLSPGTSQILRGQGTFVSDDEIGSVMGAVGTSEPQYAAELVNLQPAPAGDASKTGTSPRDKDDLYDAAVEVVIREGRGSVSLLQRALGVGYGRGARLIDFMAEDGVVGQYAGSQAREVLITLEQWAARTGERPLPPDPAPRKLRIQPHAEPRAAAPAHAAGSVADAWDEDDTEDDTEDDDVEDSGDEGDDETAGEDVDPEDADSWDSRVD